MVQTLGQRHTIPQLDEEVIHVNFTSMLDTDETIASILAEPADEDATGDLTLSAATINAATYDDGSGTVAIGKAIYFTISGQLASRGSYTITFGVTTSDGDNYSRRLIILVDQPVTTLWFFNARKRVADFLGWGRSSGEWSGDEVDRLDEIVNAGYQQFKYPEPLPNEATAHQWTFLKPKYEFDTVADTYTYDLPSTYGAPVGDMFYDEDEDEHRIIEHVSPAMIDRNRASYDCTERPYQFAVRPKTVGMSSTQVLELMLYPTPGAVYGIVGYYDASTAALSSDNPYMLGGEAHFETIVQSCRDVAAREYKDDAVGKEYEAFIRRLRASVEADRRLSPKTLGFNNANGRIKYSKHGHEFSVSLSHNLGGGP